MEYRNVGRSELRVSAVGLGCNNFGGRLDFDTTRAVVHRALDLGVTFFDVADTYGPRGLSEDYLGRILGSRRDDIVLATKFGNAMDDAGLLSGASRGYIVAAVEASLRRLRTDRIDLYQLHCTDPDTPMEETLRALDDLVRQGKVRHVGCSNLPAWQLTEAVWTARHNGLAGFVSCQDEYSLVQRSAEAELIPAIQASGVGFVPFFPLAAGLLSGKYRRGLPPPEDSRMAKAPHQARRFLADDWLDRTEKLAVFAEARGYALVELAIAWLLARPSVASVIAGASRPEHVEQNVRAAKLVLTAEDMAAIDRLAA